jgi:fumarate hydratase class II
MPGKVNPVIPEAVLMVCAQVIGNDATVTWAGAAGNFELNVMLPVIGRNLLESLTFLASACGLLADRCIDGISANEQRCLDLAQSSPAIVTPLSRYLGYEAAAAVVQQSVQEGRSIRDIVLARGHIDAGDLTEAELDEALDVLSMTRPNNLS